MIPKYQQIDKKLDYSTEEQVVGKWTDGKALYRKCLKLTTPSTSNINTNIYAITENIDTLVDIRGTVYNKGSLYKGSINSYITADDNIAVWRIL